MLTVRFVSALLLVVQLSWLGVPALCLRPETTACHTTAPAPHDHEAPTAPPSSCGMPGHCGTTVPLAQAGDVLTADLPDLSAPAVQPPSLRAADPVAPPSPPPQA